MNLTKTAANLILIGALSACGCLSKTQETTSSADTTTSLASLQKTEIYLQQPFTRALARCYASAGYAAEACARQFEEHGYVRLRNIPYKTANYDFLTKDTYPTRRWRENELTPRW